VLRAPSIAAAARITVASLMALALLEFLWEAVLAPWPGARWLAVKALRAGGVALASGLPCSRRAISVKRWPVR
jgi:uncharacterized membrane protein